MLKNGFLILCLSAFCHGAAASPLLVIDFAQPLELRVEREGAQLLLQVNQPLAELELSKRLAPLTDELASYNEGYDRLLLIAQQGYQLTAQAQGNRLIIRAEAALEVVAQEQQLGRERLRRLQAQADARNHRDFAAQRQLSQLYQEAPTQENAFELAELERKIGRWRQALSLYQRSLEQAGERQPFIEPIASLQQANRSRISYRNERADYGSDERQQLHSWEGLFSYDAHWRLGWEISQRDVEIAQLSLIDGSNTAFADDVERLSLSLQWRYANYGSGKLDWFHSENDGLGFTQEWPGTGSEWALQVLYRQPEWQRPESLAQNGFISGANLGASHRLWKPDFVFDWQTGYRRYDVVDNQHLASTWHTGVGLRSLLTSQEPRLSLGYLLDAEYVISRQRGVTDAGAEFSRLPISSSEIHSIDASAEGYLTDFIRYSGSLFYSWDRLGKAGPGSMLRLDYVLSPAVNFSLYANYTQVTDRNERDELYRWGSAITYLF